MCDVLSSLMSPKHKSGSSVKGGLQIPFPTQTFAQIPFPSQFFVEIPVPKFSTPHIRINVFSSSLTEQFRGISNLQFSVCATRLVEETY